MQGGRHHGGATVTKTSTEPSRHQVPDGLLRSVPTGGKIPPMEHSAPLRSTSSFAPQRTQDQRHHEVVSVWKQAMYKPSSEEDLARHAHESPFGCHGNGSPSTCFPPVLFINFRVFPNLGPTVQLLVSVSSAHTVTPSSHIRFIFRLFSIGREGKNVQLRTTNHVQLRTTNHVV